MVVTDKNKYNKRLALIILGIAGLLSFRLLDAAIQHNNWPGFYWSLLHVLVVAGGSYLALRRTQVN